MSATATISRPLVEALETGKIPAQIDMVRPGTFEALVNHLEEIRDEHGEGYYHIIHLDMHGALLTLTSIRSFLRITSLIGTLSVVITPIQTLANTRA